MIQLQEETERRLLAYIDTRPYGEVATLVTGWANPISAEALQAVINYLTHRPWREVNGLIIEIVNQASEQPEAAP